MVNKKMLIHACAVALTCGAGAFAQAPAPTAATAPVPATSTDVPDGGEPKYIKPETPEQRKARLGIAEDPGPNPDPNTHFWRYGHSVHIERFDRRWASYEDVDPGSVRPFAFVNSQREVYQQNDKYVWVWVPDVSGADQLEIPASPPKYSAAQLRYFEDMRSEFFDLTPKTADSTIRFTESSDGLPNSGSWRNSLAVADMNGDGCPDIITPPERKGGGVPAIFLGDCKGHWRFWSEVRWPIGLDYGSVVAADFNKDGHMDLAFGVHQVGIFVFFGDGKGNFTNETRTSLRNYATRRIAVADVDHDGYPDIVALSEGLPTASGAGRGKIRVYFNRQKGKVWEPIDVAGPQRPVAGDWLTVANLNSDSSPDIIAATIYANSNDTVFLSDGAKKWKPLAADGYLLPTLGYYYANAAGKFSSKRRDDAIFSFVRFWPADLNAIVIPDPPAKTMVGIDRLIFTGTKPKRVPIVRWPSNRPILGLAVGDFNGDGNLDLIYTRYEPREAVILLGDGKGGFTRATVEGLALDTNTNYDLKVADVNGDGKPDVILMYESMGATAFSQRDGSIRVFLNRGVGPATRAEK
ncbi:MAG TPA: VCBS repeat-containing protein [Thermoanaerobaculia bacterium]|nr:VCBS repeat-containing protein [Thermoanaerobaculia bacterium]